MTSSLALGVLMLVSFSKASIFSDELNNQIQEGMEKVKTFEELVTKEVEGVNREINRVWLYFSRAVNESTIAGKKIYGESTQKVEKITIEKFEEFVDQGEDIKILLHLLETAETTKNELDGGYDILTSCQKRVLGQKSNELRKLQNVFEFTEKFSTGFYDGLRTKMKNCEDQECVEELVQAAETKKTVLTDMFGKYVKEMDNITDGLQEGHQQCMRDAQENFNEVLDTFENDMKDIPRIQGTDDLTDLFDSVILEL